MVSPNAEARLPVDPDVKLPANVQAQIDAANKHYEQPPAPVQDQQQPPAPAAEPPAPVQDQQQQPPAPSPEPAPQPQPQPQPAPSGDYPDKSAQLTGDQWRHQYLSMKGRYEQAAQTIGGMQEQLVELGDEIARLHQVLRSHGGQPQPQPAPFNPQNPQQMGLSQDEIDALSPEMLAIIQKVSRASVMPELAAQQAQVRDMTHRMGRQSQSQVHQALSEVVPDWVAINRSARFKQWCGLRDVYSGAVRGELLRRAFQAGDTTRVIAFFKGFLDEEQATGQQPPELPSMPQVPPAPRTPAVALETLTAPGRAKPAPGDTPMPADKPIFTRQQISTFYADVRRGAYAGRDAEKDATEQAIFAAQREGRVR